MKIYLWPFKRTFCMEILQIFKRGIMYYSFISDLTRIRSSKFVNVEYLTGDIVVYRIPIRRNFLVSFSREKRRKLEYAIFRIHTHNSLSWNAFHARNFIRLTHVLRKKKLSVVYFLFTYICRPKGNGEWLWETRASSPRRNWQEKPFDQFSGKTYHSPKPIYTVEVYKRLRNVYIGDIFNGCGFNSIFGSGIM